MREVVGAASNERLTIVKNIRYFAE